jgi:hypothetical protein
MATTRKNTTREIATEFYWVSCAGSKGPCLSSVMGKVLKAFPNIEERNYPVDGDIYRISDWNCAQGIGTGNLLRLRPQNNAKMAGLKSDTLLDLPKVEGYVLAEYFCFVYFAEFRVLVLHRNRDAGGYKRLESYLNQFAESTPVVLTPVLTDQGLEVLGQMHKFTTAEFKIGDLENMSLKGWQSSSVARVLNFGKEAGAITMTVVISVDRSRKNLKNEPLKDAMHDLVNHVGDKIKSARVRGRMIDPDDDTKSRLVDLMEHHIREYVEVPYAGGYLTSDILEGLRTAYKRRRTGIQLQFTTRKSKE